MNWESQETLDLLFSLLREGKSSTEIGERMETTRSAIIGKMKRLREAGRLPAGVDFLYAKLKAANRIIQPYKKRCRKKIDIVATGQIETVTIYDNIKAPAKLEEFNAEREGVSLLDLKHGLCHWPVKDDPYLFCGAKANGTYCDFHKEWGGRAHRKQEFTYYQPRFVRR